MTYALISLVVILGAATPEPADPSLSVHHAPPFVIHVRSESEHLVPETLLLAQQMIRENASRLPVGSDPIHIIVCSTETEFRRHAGAFGRTNIGGIALSESGVIVLKSPALLRGGSSFRDVLRHELAHVLLARNIREENMPRWLNEGIAMTLSGEKRWHSLMRVSNIFLRGQVLSYRDLEAAFEQPGIENEFGDAYAQALLMTRYLLRLAGDETFWSLVFDLKDMSFGDALRKWTTLSPLEFYERWVRSFSRVAAVASVVSGLGLFQLGAMLVIFAYIRRQRRSRQILEQWAEEEEDNEDEGVETDNVADWEEYTDDWEDES